MSAHHLAQSSPAALTLAPIAYAIDAADVRAHLYRIRLKIAQPQAQQRVALPAWIPGSYLLREFAKHLQNLRATQGGQARAVQQLDKNTWQIEADEGKVLQLDYEVYAFDASVRTAWLDAQRGFFNPTSLCLQVQGQTQRPHALRLILPQQTPAVQVHAAQAAAQVSAQAAVQQGPPNAQGAWVYHFDHYDHLADTPFVFGADLWCQNFEAAGITHQFVIAGAPPNMDGDRLIADCQRICAAQQAFWQMPEAPEPIFKHYLFMLHATEDGYGGLEHGNSTALICARQDLPRVGEAAASKGYITLLGLISHEYFHSWNVKRLRPAELAVYDYSRETYTELLWFFEGFTSYYDDLFLCRTGLIDPAQYLALLARNIQTLAINPGAQVQSVAQASFDAWTKYYRPDENTLNATVSYYTKGALVALCLDLTLRREGPGSLDEVMRQLWRRSGGGPISEGDIAAALEQIGGRSFAPELQAWVHGRGDLPLQDLLASLGVEWQCKPPTWAQRLGVKVQEGSAERSLAIQTVLRGSCAEAAGLAAGDEWLGIGVAGQLWRLRQLEQLAYLLPAAAQTGQQSVEILYCRGQRMVQGTLQLAAAQEGLGLVELRLPRQGAEGARAWLATV